MSNAGSNEVHLRWQSELTQSPLNTHSMLVVDDGVVVVDRWGSLHSPRMRHI